MAIRKERMHLVKLNFIFFFLKRTRQNPSINGGEPLSFYLSCYTYNLELASNNSWLNNQLLINFRGLPWFLRTLNTYSIDISNIYYWQYLICLIISPSLYLPRLFLSIHSRFWNLSGITISYASVKVSKNRSYSKI